MKLGFSDGSQVADNSVYPFKSSIVNRAFTTVNGTSFIDEHDDGKGKVRSLPFGLAALACTFPTALSGKLEVSEVNE